MAMKSELDSNFWAIVTESEVICTNKTYAQCEAILENTRKHHTVNGVMLLDAAYIVTNPTAYRMLQGIINRNKYECAPSVSQII